MVRGLKANFRKMARNNFYTRILFVVLKFYFLNSKKIKFYWALHVYSILFFGFVSYYIVGGVVLDREVAGGNYFFIFRRNRDEWVEVSRFVYNVELFYHYWFVANVILMLSMLILYFIVYLCKNISDISE